MTDQLDVYLDGGLAGRLTRVRSGEVTFDYIDGGTSLSATSLSASLPRSISHHPAERVMPWIDNLLPDNDQVRANWAATFGERRVTAFDLLRHMGADCAGAVQIIPPDQAPDQAGALDPISDAEIASHIRALRRDEAAWDFPQRGGRWSLGGQQGKFALARTPDGRWLAPSGRAASTHIMKVGIAGVPDSDIAEFVTMRAAQRLGLPVPYVEYAVFDGEPVLVTTRFDRVVSGDSVRRLHQEDFCQAMGLWRTMKYQADGGPSAGDLADFLRRQLDPRDRSVGLLDLARVLVFNQIVAGTDAHAKNYALLHIGTRLVLAPFYDLTSAAFLWPAKQVHYEGRLAMKFGGEYRLSKVDLGRYEQAAAELGVNTGFLVDTARGYVERLPDAARDALDDLPPMIDARRRSHFLDGIVARVKWVHVA